MYRNWSFRATPDLIKELYFIPEGDEYALKTEIKQMVTFAQLNLADTGYPSLATNTNNIDVIFCRNALMYFSQDTVVRVVGNFYNALAPGGWLVVNPSEATPALFNQYEVVTQPDAILFRKGIVAGNTTSESAAKQTTDDGRWTIKACSPTSSAVRRSSPAGRSVNRPSPGPQPMTNDEAHNLARLAGIEANQGRLGEALELSDQAIQADKTNPAYWYLRATILQELGELSEAAAALKRVLYLDPGFMLAHFVLGNIALQAMRKVEATRHFNAARAQLKNHHQDDILHGSDDLTAGQLESLITKTEDEDSSPRSWSDAMTAILGSERENKILKARALALARRAPC